MLQPFNMTNTIVSSRAFPFPSADKLRAKVGRTMVACAVARALANLAEAWEMSERSRGKV